MKKNYRILGVSETATDAEVYEAYSSLRAKYKEEMFLDGEKGNQAAKKLTELERAYEEIKTYRLEHTNTNSEGLLKDVDAAIKANDLKRAQEILDSFNERSAEWHYLQAVVFYQKGWANESKKQLEIARQMSPNTEKYDKAYDKMNERLNANNNVNNGQYTGGPNNGGAYGGNPNNGGNYNEPQMGGDGCLDFCCRLAICNLLLNCCCNCR